MPSASLAVFGAFAFGVVGGCGGEAPSEPLVGPAPTTVGELSEESKRNPLIRDAEAINDAMDSARGDEAVNGIYDLINRAGEAEVAEGAQMIRDELPPLVDLLAASAPEVRAKVKSLRLETEAGEAFRDIALLVLEGQVSGFESLAEDVARSDKTWGAMVRWGEKNNKFIETLNARLDEVLQGIPQDQKAALDQAVRELFGDQ